MKKLLMTTAALLIAGPALAATPDRPAGWQGMDCDPDMFTAVMSELNPGTVLYWNNRTCKVAGGPSDDLSGDAEEVSHEEEPEDEGETELDL